jgi:biopolymer transport protein ExbD
MALKKRTHVSPEFNLASMIDVIFLLLMFFMLTSNLVSTNALRIQLPTSSQKEALPVKTINVSLKTDGSMYFEQDANALDKATLRGKMQDRVEAMEIEGITNDKIVVILNAEGTTTTQQLVDVMTITRQLGLQMSLSTKEAPDGQ